MAKIPFYKEVILSSFSCPHCHYSNNEIQSAGDILDHGIEWNLRVEESVDINRQVIKSDYASISIPELDLEIPGKTQKGEITTLEGILDRVYNGLDQDQARRKEEHPEDYEKIQKFLERIRDAQALTIPFSLVKLGFRFNFNLNYLLFLAITLHFESNIIHFDFGYRNLETLVVRVSFHHLHPFFLGTRIPDCK